MIHTPAHTHPHTHAHTHRVAASMTDYGPTAKAQLQQEIEMQSSGNSSLTYKLIEYSAPPLIWLSLPLSRHTSPCNDGLLTWVTGPEFTSLMLGDSILSRVWTMDAQRAGKRGRAAHGFPTSQLRIQDDARDNPKPGESHTHIHTHTRTH